MSRSHQSNPLICVVGPTAVGKSSCAISLAQKFHADILSADAFAVYRGLNIGTAKPVKADCQKVKHHLIDVCDLDHHFDVHQFVAHASRILRENSSRLMIVSGGSSYYLHALWHGLYAGPPANPDLRQNFYLQAETQGCVKLWEQLWAVDSVSAKRLHPHDLKRVVRALEVYTLTGKTLSEQTLEWPGLKKNYSLHVIGLYCPLDLLRLRIAKRVEQMFDQGLLEEVQNLVHIWHKAPVLREAVGYKEVLNYLDNGSLAQGEHELKKEIQTHTYQLAKKQLTWLKRENMVEWFDISKSSQLQIHKSVSCFLERVSDCAE